MLRAALFFASGNRKANRAQKTAKQYGAFKNAVGVGTESRRKRDDCSDRRKDQTGKNAPRKGLSRNFRRDLAAYAARDKNRQKYAQVGKTFRVGRAREQFCAQQQQKNKAQCPRKGRNQQKLRKKTVRAFSAVCRRMGSFDRGNIFLHKKTPRTDAVSFCTNLFGEILFYSALFSVSSEAFSVLSLPADTLKVVCFLSSLPAFFSTEPMADLRNLILVRSLPVSITT